MYSGFGFSPERLCQHFKERVNLWKEDLFIGDDMLQYQVTQFKYNHMHIHVQVIAIA